MTKQPGLKYDAGKPLAGILYEDFPTALQQIISVATFGAKKYARGNWKDVQDAEVRYWDAMHRHLLAYCSGPGIDEESGESHLAHAAWCMLALMELPRIGQKDMATGVSAGIYLNAAPIPQKKIFCANSPFWKHVGYGETIDEAVTNWLRNNLLPGGLFSFNKLRSPGIYQLKYTSVGVEPQLEHTVELQVDQVQEEETK